jgi:hypothetical protein
VDVGAFYDTSRANFFPTAKLLQKAGFGLPKRLDRRPADGPMQTFAKLCYDNSTMTKLAEKLDARPKHLLAKLAANGVPMDPAHLACHAKLWRQYASDAACIFDHSVVVEGFSLTSSWPTGAHLTSTTVSTTPTVVVDGGLDYQRGGCFVVMGNGRGDTIGELFLDPKQNAPTGRRHYNPQEKVMLEFTGVGLAVAQSRLEGRPITLLDDEVAVVTGGVQFAACTAAVGGGEPEILATFGAAHVMTSKAVTLVLADTVMLFPSSTAYVDHLVLGGFWGSPMPQSYVRLRE